MANDSESKLPRPYCTCWGCVYLRSPKCYGGMPTAQQRRNAETAHFMITGRQPIGAHTHAAAPPSSLVRQTR